MELAPDVMAGLRARYGEPHRAYHTWAHVEALLALADGRRDHIADPKAMTLAILFHDAVYDPRAGDNERRSTVLMHGTLAGILDPATLDRAEALILATETHSLPETTDPTLESDAALFLDMDLAILGAPPAHFADYDAAIRREFSHVPDELYRIGRIAVLNRFLSRDRLYLTDAFHHQLETQARSNLAAAIVRLESEH